MSDRDIPIPYTELATLLVRERGIHEGIWGICFNFGLTATNLGPDDANVLPCAIVQIPALSLHRFEKITSISVDAAVVNPRPRESRAKSRKRG